jgi:DNA-binding FadR family transcriptional regulator
MPDASTRTPVSAAVYADLRREILSDTLRPGVPLRSERELADSFGVNRHAVREALKRLQQAGLIAVSQGGATSVLDWRRNGGLDLLPHLALRLPGRFDPKVLRSALEMRISIGADAARLCARRAEDSLVDRLLGIVEEMEGADDMFALSNLDTELWAVIVDGADNIAYQLAFNSLIRSLQANREPAMALIESELRDRGSRRTVVEAIAVRDEETASVGAREALAGSLEVVIDFFSL